MRPDYMAFLFALSGVVSFNAGIWQVMRRKQKRQLMERHKNLLLPPLHTLPPDGADMSQYEFRRVELDGSFDNDGTCIVGPRSVPSYKGAASTDESRGGYLLLTPFQLARPGDDGSGGSDDAEGQVLMVNRGWAPIDAGKYGVMLRQYTGEGVVRATLRGIVRREEYMSGSLWSGKCAENDGPVAADLGWFVIRPYEMAMSYYRQRWGSDRAAAVARARGVHHYFVEMLEDYTGDDQRIVRGHAWPRRRDVDEVTYVHLTPIVHTMYIVFWWSVTAGSLYGMSKCWQRQKAIFALRRHVDAQTTRMLRARQQNAQAYMDAMKDVERRQAQRQQRLHASGSGGSTSSSSSSSSSGGASAQ